MLEVSVVLVIYLDVFIANLTCHMLKCDILSIALPILNTSCGGLSTRSNNLLVNVFQVRNYAARKGTREKARKKKVKVEEKKIGFIPHNQRGLDR